MLAAGRIQPSDRQLMEVSRALNPVLYTSGDRFEPDEAISQPLIPALASAIRLGALSASDGGFARVTLSRGQARVIDALERARAALRSVRSAQ